MFPNIILSKYLPLPVRVGFTHKAYQTFHTRPLSYLGKKMTDIETNLADGVFMITFNRPSKRNAITKEMMKTVISHLNHTAKDDNVKVLVLTGSGNFYSSGNDFSPSADFDVFEGLSNFQNFVAALIDYPKLLVAVVNGPAIGMACTTLALCDIIYASDKTYFQTPFTQLGLVAEGCSTYTFPRIFGVAKASKLLYLNEALPVQEAAQAGIITQVFPQHELQRESHARIKELASLPLKSLMLTKQLVRRWDREILHRANEEEVKLLIDRFHSEDFANAISNPETFKIIKSKL